MTSRVGRPVSTDPPTGTLVFSDTGNYATLARQQQAGRAVRLAPGIYVVRPRLPAAECAAHHLWAIVARIWPGAVVCDRSALAGGAVDGWLYLCQPVPTRRADLRLPGVTVTCRVGPEALPGDMRFPHGLHLSGSARGLVENMSSGGRPPKNRPARAAGESAVGDTVDDLASSGNPDTIKNTLAQLDLIGDHFDPRAVAQVRRLLTAALGTLSAGPIASSRLAARVAGEPFDAERLRTFRSVLADLQSASPSIRPVIGAASERQWLPFFEAYFSNYIEGTTFSVEEARRIAIDGEVPPERPADAHDVSATYRIVNDVALMSERAAGSDDFAELLRDRHRTLMAARPDKNPGLFKLRPNYAGGTAFVAPAQLMGTIKAGWDLCAEVVDPFQRAVMIMFLITECHPFDDGNGRLARIMSNAELIAHDQWRIVIPTSYRGNYLAALSGATHNGSGAALHSALDFTRLWVSSIDWSDWQRSVSDLNESHAFEDSPVAERTGRRLRIVR